MVQTIARGTALSVAALAILSSAAVSASARAGVAVNAAPQVVPAVQQWTGGVGLLRLGPDTKIVLDPAGGR
ncbi:hypothetical protein [Actinokineospora sp.]|uniref:hypothetical protein n=1 Tax=Actinokineospora sp. TaxID=1872133 RepID=UPI003D6A0ABC